MKNGCGHITKHLIICPNCAYSSADWRETTCPRCRTELIGKCPFCTAPICNMNAIYCDACGAKLRISWVPIQ